MKIRGSSRKWSDSTWTHRKQLEQLLQQVTTLRGDIASSRPMQTKACCRIATREACRLLQVVKVVQVVFHVSTSNHSIFEKNRIFLQKGPMDCTHCA